MFDSSLQRIRDLTGMAERQQELSARVARLTPFDGSHQSALPALQEPLLAMANHAENRLGTRA